MLKKWLKKINNFQFMDKLNQAEYPIFKINLKIWLEVKYFHLVQGKKGWEKVWILMTK